MKKILYLLLCLSCLQVNAQILTVNYSENTVTCTITKEDSTIINSLNGTIDYHGVIKKVGFKEATNLKTIQTHVISVNGVDIATLRGKNSNSMNLTPPCTLRPGEKLICKRGTQQIGTIIKKEELSIKELIGKVRLKLTNPKNASFEFSKDTISSFTCLLEGLNKLKSDTANCHILCNGREIPFSINDETISFNLNPTDLEKDTLYQVKFVYDIKKQPKYANNEVLLYQVKSPFEHKSSILILVLVSVFGVVLLFGIVFLLWRFVKKTKFKNSTIFVCTKYGKQFRIICNEKPKIGDISNKRGECLTENGLIIRSKKKHFWNLWNKVYFIGQKITCENESFVLVHNDAINKCPSFNFNLNDEIITIQFNDIIEKENGRYDIAGYQLEIEANKVRSIAKKVIDVTGKVYFIVLNSNTPQCGDKVLPTIKQKHYSITSFDGYVFSVTNNKIVDIKTRALKSNEIELVSIEGEKFTVIPKGDKPVEGDIAMPDGNYKLEDNTTYIVQSGQIVSIKVEMVQEVTIELLQEQLGIAKKKIQDLEKQLQSITQENIEARIQAACDTARSEENKKVTTAYRNKIDKEYITIALYNKEKATLEKQKNDADKAKDEVLKQLKKKESALTDAKTENDTLKKENREKDTKIITLNATCSKLKDAAQKKNMYYLLQVQETLAEVSEGFIKVYRDMNNAAIKEGLITPMTKGVSGLSAGILSWNEDFTVRVMDDAESFFGCEFLTMEENDVKEQLSKKFISNIVKSDSFSKFIRLYQLSTVPFIRKQFIDAKMDIDTLNKLFYKVYSLMTDFGYSIVCPRLFDEQHSDKKYQWFNSTNLFNIIDLPEEEKARIKAMGSETIIDVNQIGYDSQWISRKATAVTPDF